MAAWSERVNLTGARSPERRVAVLVAPVLPLAPLVSGPHLDVGSGSGSPGLVLGLLLPELELTLLEPRRRRWAFLREAARVAGRPDVRVLALRHDEWPGPPFPSVSVRGLRLPPQELAGLVAPGGRLLVLGRAPGSLPGLRPEPGPPGSHLFRRA